MNTLYTVLVCMLLLYIFGYAGNKRVKNKIISISDNNCIRCRRCIKKCRHKILELVDDDFGQHITLKYPEKCTACGNCVAVCNFNALKLASRK